MSVRSDIFDEGSFEASFVAKKSCFAVQSQRLTANKRVSMFPAVHRDRVLIKVKKYLCDNCKFF